MGETLKSQRRCAKAAKCANSIMIAIKASLMTITFIRPHLECSFAAWWSWLRKDIKLLEGVQRRYTKLVESLQDIEYEERAQLLNIDSLSCRMDKGEMILV